MGTSARRFRDKNSDAYDSSRIKPSLNRVRNGEGNEILLEPGV